MNFQKNKHLFLLSIGLFLTTILGAQKSKPVPFHQPPSWSKEAIWYQIFIERFRNGSTQNDPTLETCYNALSDQIPNDWQLTPWGQNWYEQESWAKETGLDFYRTIQMRRYGGDLHGVEEKIPYLKSLGINAIYFNPLNDAPSLHKYDARYYHHIDVTLGDDPKKDLALMATEDPSDPKTWVWTSADQKFINLVKKLHSEGIRVVLDFSWNHTGKNFWAFKDIEKNGQSSKYADWYQGAFVKDETTGQTKYTYEGWIGISSLPEWKEINPQNKRPGHPFEGTLHPDVTQHIFDVSRRWIDPNGDGLFDDGIDGMRLDVAEHVPLGFWRDFRKYVRNVNPDFYLVGENWWTQWPDVLMDPLPWVKGDVFDAVMHYQWYKVARDYFANSENKLSLSGFKSGIDSVFLKYPEYTRQAMMNLSASHDAPRLLTCFANPSKYKYNAVPRDNEDYNTATPDNEVAQRVKLFLLHQYTFVGSPHIWNGDEMGMTGADDPDCRKPLPWPDIPFETETSFSGSKVVYAEKPSFKQEWFDYYQSLITFRKKNPAFTYGKYEFISIADKKNILAYFREYKEDKYLVVLNNNPETQIIFLPNSIVTDKPCFQVGGADLVTHKKLNLPAFSGIVIPMYP